MNEARKKQWLAKPIADFLNLPADDHKAHDEYFKQHGPGNTVERSHYPFERLALYELLLGELQRVDRQKYLRIHKGTPFYFMFWTAFDCALYERAFFFADAAISENQRNYPDGWQRRQSCNVFRLKNTGPKAAGRAVDLLTRLFKGHIDDFNVTAQRNLTVSDFVSKFVLDLVGDPKKRSILSGLFSLVAEFETLSSHLAIRSERCGSIQPFTAHLFRGALVLESLLKALYPKRPNGKTNKTESNKTLRDIYIKTPQFRNDFGLGANHFSITASSLKEALNDLKDSSIGWPQKSFQVVGKIRNTTAHSLLLEDEFSTPADFAALFTQEMRAILCVVETKFR